MNPLHGLYAITDACGDNTAALVDKVKHAIAGGARIIQYRDKSDNPALRKEQACALLTLCRQHKIPLIINDDVALAKEIGADGVHLGKDDGDIQQARAQLGSGIIGISCYNDWHRAEAAARGGADYIAFGAFFPSATKPEAVKADPELLHRSKRELDLPVVAIGGITPANGAALISSGADMLAVVHGVFGQADVEAAARRYSELF